MEKDTMFTYSLNKYILRTCSVQAMVLIVEGIKQTWFLPSGSLKSSRKDSLEINKGLLNEYSHAYTGDENRSHYKNEQSRMRNEKKIASNYQSQYRTE